MARPPVERPEGARVDDPIGERPEGARGEEACQLRGRRDVPDQSLSEDREAPPLRGGAPGSRTLGGGGRAPHLRRPRCHGRRLGRTTVLPGEGGAAGTAGRAAGSPAPPRSHLDPKMAITVPAPAGPPRRWRGYASSSARPRRPPPPAIREEVVELGRLGRDSARERGEFAPRGESGRDVGAGHRDGHQRCWRGGGASGAVGTIAPSVSSTVRLACFSWRGCPARRRITAASCSSASLRAESEGPRRSMTPTPAVPADREHVTIAERPAGLRRPADGPPPAGQAVACAPKPAHGDDIRAAATPEPQLGPPLLPRGNDGAACARGAHMGRRLGQPLCVCGKPGPQ